MLRLTLEFVPFGQESCRKTISVMTIANDGTGTHTIGNYKYKIIDKESVYPDIKGKIEKFPRVAKKAWDLVLEILLRMLFCLVDSRLLEQVQKESRN